MRDNPQWEASPAADEIDYSHFPAKILITVVANHKTACVGQDRDEFPQENEAMAGELAVIVPAFNEEATVSEIIRRLQARTIIRSSVVVDESPIPNPFKSGIA